MPGEGRPQTLENVKSQLKATGRGRIPVIHLSDQGPTLRIDAEPLQINTKQGAPRMAKENVTRCSIP